MLKNSHWPDHFCSALVLHSQIQPDFCPRDIPCMASLPFVQCASWIWSAERTHSVALADHASPSHYQVRYFRRTFQVASPQSTALTVHVSADSRYVFYCNG